MTGRAAGDFEVTLAPLPASGDAEGTGLGRMSIAKRFRGDLLGTSRGEMLTGMTAVPGSAGYVAIERVEGSIGGRSGTFLLQHSGTMDRSAQSLSITVVPDSGTGELAGISGAMTIRIAEGRHSYELQYSLPEAGPD